MITDFDLEPGREIDNFNKAKEQSTATIVGNLLTSDSPQDAEFAFGLYENQKAKNKTIQEHRKSNK